MKIIYITLLISFIFPTNNFQLIDSIVINGNKRTKDYIIKREILHPIGSLDSLILNEDINRLYNLGIFSKVNIYVDNQTYYIDVIESFSIIPILDVNYDEIKEDFTYIVGIADINFMGRNQSFFLGNAFGGEKVYFLGLNNPWIFGDHISFKTEFENRESQNIFYEFDFDEKINLIELGFYKGLKNRFKFGLKYYKNTIQEPSASNQYYDLIIDKGLQHKYIITNFNYQYDTRDIYIDPTKGFLFQFQGSNYKGLNLTESFKTFSFYFKQYFSPKINFLNSSVLSYKVYTLFKYPDYENLPIFSYEYLGGEDYVRGYSSIIDKNPIETKEKIENSNVFYTAFEIQNTILKRKNYDKIEFGLDGFVFIDLGLGSKKYNQFNLNNTLIGYGFGLKFFIAPVTLSFSIGFNPYGQSHFHLSSD